MTKSQALKKAAIPERWFKMFLLFMKLWEHEFASVEGKNIVAKMAKKAKLPPSAVLENYVRHLVEHGLIERVGHGKYVPTKKGISTYQLYTE